MEKYLGLTKEEAIKNQLLYGLNTCKNKSKYKLLKNIFSILKDPILIFLMISIITNILLNEMINVIILCIYIFVLITIKIIQKVKISKSLKTINSLSSIKACVIRDKALLEIDSENITIDDLMVLKKGDKILADAIILGSKNLYVDESILTNDNTPVSKSIDLINKDATLKSNYVYSETFVTSGSAICKVMNIGSNTFYNKNLKDYSKKNKLKIPFQKPINNIIKIFTIIAVLTCIVISIMVGINEKSFINALLSGITILIGSIPLEIQLIIMFLIILSSYNLIKKNVVIRNLESIKKLKSINYLCIDKTGIITKDNMEVGEIRTNLDKKEIINHFLLSSSTNDLKEKAILNYSKKLNCNDINEEIVKKYPFNNNTNMSANVYSIDDQFHIYVSGTLESLFDICDLSVEEKYQLYNCRNDMSKRGFEIIAVGSGVIKEIKEDIFDYRIKFDGLIGLYQPIKNDVKESIKVCQDSGIKIIMFTNDNIDISMAIAKEIGISNYENIITGNNLNELNNDEFNNIVNNYNIFSNISPSHKLKLINALKNNKNIIATIGSDVCDEVILKNSNISIAMKNAPDITKEVSDLILLDDNFKTIVNTIKASKQICNNIKKSIKYILIINLFIYLFTLAITLLKLPLVISIINIVVMKLLIYLISFIIFKRQKI